MITISDSSATVKVEITADYDLPPNATIKAQTKYFEKDKISINASGDNVTINDDKTSFTFKYSDIASPAGADAATIAAAIEAFLDSAGGGVATEATLLLLLAQLNPTLSLFREDSCNSTAQAIKASAGEIWGINVINKDATSDIFIKLYDEAAGTVDPATDDPVQTYHLPIGTSSIYEPPNMAKYKFNNAISIRVVTSVVDTSTAAPATSPLVEILYK